MERLLEQVVAQDTKARAELQAKLDQTLEQMETLRDEVVEAKVHAAVVNTERRIREELQPPEAISSEQLAALQGRLETLHEAKLLSEEELFALEDLCADATELQLTVGAVTKEMIFSAPGPAFEAATKVHKLVGLSEQFAGDAAFARQAKRKFVRA